MSIIWAALIFAAGLFLGALLAFLVVVLVAPRIDDEPETLFEAGWDQ
jgi:hypothetical protein